MSDTYQKSDHRSLELHTLVADKIEQNPLLIQIALSNIEKWKSQNDFNQPYLDEWVTYIEKGNNVLIPFLKSNSEKAARLRSSSPFVGIISQQERKIIFAKYND